MTLSLRHVSAWVVWGIMSCNSGIVDTLGRQQNRQHFGINTYKCIVSKEKFVLQCPIGNESALVYLMPIGDNHLPEPTSLMLSNVIWRHLASMSEANTTNVVIKSLVCSITSLKPFLSHLSQTHQAFLGWNWFYSIAANFFFPLNSNKYEHGNEEI